MMDSLEYHKLAQRFGSPDFVKESDIPGEEELEQLPRDRFADPGRRQYPTHTKAATWLSLARCWDRSLYNATPNRDVAQRLSKAAQFWDILPEETRVLEKVAREIQAAEDAQAFALEETSPSGERVRRFPVTGPQETLKSAYSLREERTMLPLPWKRRAAQRILKAAQDHQVDSQILDETHEYLERAAGRGISSLEKLAEAFTLRRGMLRSRGPQKDLEAAEVLAKMAQAVKDLSETDLDTCVKAAEALDTADRRHRLYLQYNNGLELPEVSCHHVLRKHAMAKSANYAILPGGRMYRRADLEKISQDIRNLLPTDEHDWIQLDGTMNMDKAASVFKQMPADQQALVESACRAHGIQPERAPKSFADLMHLD